MADADAQVTPIYHEKQKLQYCLIHTMNNILQRQEYSKEKMDGLCYELNESKWLNPHKSWLGLGNYDANIMMSALNRHSLKAIWFDKRSEVSTINTDLLKAVVVNVDSKWFVPLWSGRHWFAVVKLNGRFLNLDSKNSQPTEIADLHAFIQDRINKDKAEVMLVTSIDVDDGDVIKRKN